MKKNLFLLTIVITALLLTACGGQQNPQTNNPADQGVGQIDAIYTQAAETLSAEYALTEAAQPLPTNTLLSSPTPVILSTNTPMPVLASPTPFPTLPSISSPTPFPTQPSTSGTGGRPCLRAEWLFESPIDGWVLRPGESFTKEFRFGNSGSCTWTGEFRLVLTDGTNFGDTSIYNLRDISDITDLGVPNGNRLIIRLSFQAPDTPGHYVGYYMLADPSGVLFGLGDLGNERFWVDIIVRE